MSQVIAGIYEVKQKIGSGGGGIVYLAYHKRLNVPVVLKADKRKLSVGKEKLRREVDLLKGLSQTYIPHVYDFVQEDGVVYTVMDYIEGESLDKLLKRGVRPSQPQVIRWAYQILEALSYLHSRPPYGILHGDIKPANIMLRPSGDICLIDYNIALALGEEGAVKVGFSRGYASPEHYRSEDMVVDIEESDETVQDDDITLPMKKEVVIDVRSDIYSLGATLYHLLSGHKPEQNAEEVIPLSEDVCSPAVAEIIQKAMQANPEMRYQSAEEMSLALRRLHSCDKRIVRFKHQKKTMAALLTGTFLLGGISVFVGLKQMEQHQHSLTLAEYSGDALKKGDIPSAVELALKAIPEGKNILEAPVTAQAQKALTDALGVYDLSDGFKSFKILNLPSIPFGIKVSGEGTKFAVNYAYETAVYDMETQQKLAVLPMNKSAMADVCFLDENTIVYAGISGVTAYDIEQQKELWTGEEATTLAVSGDRATVAAVNREQDYAVIYRSSDGEQIMQCSFGTSRMISSAKGIFANPEKDVFVMNQDGTMLAVSFANGGLCIYNLQNPEESMEIFAESETIDFDGGFFENYFAFVANRKGTSEFRIINLTEKIQVGKYESRNPMKLKTDKDGIYLADGNLLACVNPDSLEKEELADTKESNITGFTVDKDYVLIATDDNRFSLYDREARLAVSEQGTVNSDFLALTAQYAVLGNRNEPALRIMKSESNEETQLFSYDSDYPHDEARVSKDGKTAMLYSYKEFAVYDRAGNKVTEVELPNADAVYDQQFRKSKKGSWLEVIWHDGTVRCYSAKDGSLISEKQGEIPGKDLYEEFETDAYQIKSYLHSAAEVYDLQSGKLVGKLEEDSYLICVTELGKYILTEYINSEGEKYGLLVDQKLQTVAYLPNLCDVTDAGLVFDYRDGTLRQCPLYSLKELTDIGKAEN